MARFYSFYDFANHPHTSLAKAKQIIPERVFGTLHTFGVVREPVDWLFSVYRHWKRRAETSRDSYGVPKTVHTFEDFVRFRMDEYTPLQAYQFIDTDGASLASSLGRYEFLDDYLEILQAKLGVHLSVGHDNASQRSALDKPSSLECRLAEAACELDYTLFDFTSDAPEVNLTLDSSLQHKLTESFALAGGLRYDPWYFHAEERTS